jgi:hypothetical protein
MSISTPGSTVNRDGKLVNQAHKILTYACENRNVLFEPRRENFPYHLRKSLSKCSVPIPEIEAYLYELIDPNNQDSSKEKVSEEIIVQPEEGDAPLISESMKIRGEKLKLLLESNHKKFVRSASKLIANSNSVNESIFFVISTYDKNLQGPPTTSIGKPTLSFKASDLPKEEFESY